MAKVKKASKMPEHQTNGALPNNAHKPSKSIYEIMNGHRSVPYSAATVEEYYSSLKNMSLIQLQDHAMSLGTVIPTDDRNRMIDKLVKEFAAYQSKVAQATNTSQVNAGVSSKASKSTEEILSKFRYGGL